MPRPSHLQDLQKRMREKQRERKQEAPKSNHHAEQKSTPKEETRPRFRLQRGPGGRMIMRRTRNTAMDEKKGNFLMGLLRHPLVMKVLNSRASQFISAGVGFLVGQLMSTGFLEKIQDNEALTQFLTDVGIAPTEAGITGLLTGLFWALYNMGMTMAYGAKFKEIQEAHGLKADRWAGPKTMAAALEKKGDA